MASSPLTSSYKEVSPKVLIQIPEHEQFFTNLFPWDQIDKVEEHIEAGRFRITLIGPMRGDLEIKGKQDEFIQEGKTIVKQLVSCLKGKGKNSEMIIKILKNCIENADLTEAWKGLNQTHILWDKQVEVSLHGKKISFITSEEGREKHGLRVGLNIHDMTQVLFNLLPYPIYSTTAAPFFVTKGIMKFTWTGYQSVRPVQVTYTLKNISFPKKKIQPALGIEKSRSIPFQLKEEQIPFDETSDGVPLSLNKAVPEELLHFFGKYVSWESV